jgi:hypothetical protein
VRRSIAADVAELKRILEEIPATPPE